MSKRQFYFTGLLAEIRAAGLTDEQYTQICASMNTTRERIDEVLCHAEYHAEAVKGNICVGTDIHQWLEEEDTGYLDDQGYHKK